MNLSMLLVAMTVLFYHEVTQHKDCSVDAPYLTKKMAREIASKIDAVSLPPDGEDVVWAYKYPNRKISMEIWRDALDPVSISYSDANWGIMRFELKDRVVDVSYAEHSETVFVKLRRKPKGRKN